MPRRSQSRRVATKPPNRRTVRPRRTNHANPPPVNLANVNLTIDQFQGVSDETRAALKAIIAKQQRLDKDFLDARHAQKLAGTADGAALLAALDAPDATDESRFEAIRKYADDLDEAFRTEFPGAAERDSATDARRRSGSPRP